MAALASVTNFIKNNSKLLSRGVGIIGLGIVGYDAHYMGKIQSDLYASERDANSGLYYLNNDMYSPNMSKFEDNIREASFNMEINQGWKRLFNEGIGYFKGFGSMLVNHAVPFALGIAAVCGSKIGAIGLGVVGLHKFIRNFFGFGTPNGLTK